MKQLHEMTPGELGKLFPVFLTDHNPQWPSLYKEEEKLIRGALGDSCVVRISHIGSTAIPVLKAKPVIDILLEVPEPVNRENLLNGLESIGYLLIPKPENPDPHMMWVKGYTPDGFRGQAYHIHVRYPGDWDEFRFRDFLISHPEVAREYEDIKIQLAGTFPNDREGYTDGKSTFIKSIMQRIMVVR